MAAITKEQFVEMHVFQGMSEREIAEKVGVTTTTVYSYRDKFGFIPRSRPKYPKCPRCGRTTNFIKDEGLGFCPECLIYIDKNGKEAFLKWGNNMELKEYQLLAERTANRGPEDTAEQRYINFAFGLAGETGEVIDCLKKHLFHGHPLDKEKLKIELGDVLWYVATIATTADIELGVVAEANIEKLRGRYPDGFDTERSLHRGGKQ